MPSFIDTVFIRQCVPKEKEGFIQFHPKVLFVTPEGKIAVGGDHQSDAAGGGHQKYHEHFI
jgi:hypothetical protein